MKALKDYTKVTVFMVIYIGCVTVAVRMGWEPPEVGSIRMGRGR